MNDLYDRIHTAILARYPDAEDQYGSLSQWIQTGLEADPEDNSLKAWIHAYELVRERDRQERAEWEAEQRGIARGVGSG